MSDELHDQHLLIHQQFIGTMRAEKELERRYHDVERVIPQWRRILPRIVRGISLVVAAIEWPLRKLEERYLDDEGQVRWWEQVTVYDETVEEHATRLRELAKKGLNSIPVHSSPYVPEGTAYLFDPTMLKLPVPLLEESLEWLKKPNPDWAQLMRDLRVPPSVAKVILDEHADEGEHDETSTE